MTNGQISRKGTGGWLAAMSLGMFLALAPQAARAEGTAAVAASHVGATPLSPPAASAPEDASQRQLRYARREATAPQAAAFKGQGAGIYIGGSSLALVLLIVLIVVLL